MLIQDLLQTGLGNLARPSQDQVKKDRAIFLHESIAPNLRHRQIFDSFHLFFANVHRR